MNNRPLSEKELLELVESDEFWGEEENIENEALPSSDKLDACTSILDYGDESDKEEDDEELLSDHYTDSEEEWEPESNEIDSDGSVEDDTVVESNEQIDASQSGNIATENKEIRTNYWYGKKDKMKWSKTAPKKGKTTSNNLIKFLSGVKGLARVHPPTTPLESWRLFFDDSMIENIVQFTNQRIDIVAAKYSQCKRKKNARRSFFPTFIKNTDKLEIEAFIGLLYLQGVFKSGHEDLRSLWATDGTGRDIFRATMPLARFSFLLCCIRFDDDTTRADRRKENKVAAISELFDKFVTNSKQNYTPGDNVTIDEMLVPFRGRCGFRMFIPNKPAKYGIKVQILADSQTHYMLNAEIYAGKELIEKKAKNFAIPTQVVLRLVEPIKNTGRNVTADNWYSSIELLRELAKLNLTFVGTVKKNKTFIPLEFMPSSKRKEESSIFGFTAQETIVSYVPKKNKSVTLISSTHHDDKVDEKTKKPDIILFYNSTKAGVDALDQKCANYTTSRRSRRWPMTIFYALLNIGGVNSRVIYQFARDGKEMSRYNFLKQLGRDLCIPHVQKRYQTSLPRSLKASIFNMIGDTLPPPPAPQQRQGVSKRKRCAICPAKKDRKTSTYCEMCHNPVCMKCAKSVCPNCI